MKIAVCPGSFDPLTLGHLSIIRRASGLFDQVIVLVLSNPNKTPTFSTEERIAMVQRCISDFPNVSVDTSSGLLVDYLKKVGACAIVKGLRAFSDFEYEFQMALANKKMCPTVETVFLTTDSNQSFLSSSLVREIASLGGDIHQLVPQEILEEIQNTFRRKMK